MARKRKVKVTVGKGQKVIKVKIPNKVYLEAIEMAMERFLKAKGGKQ